MDPNTTKIWPSSAHQRSAILLAFCLRADDGPILNGVSLACRLWPEFSGYWIHSLNGVSLAGRLWTDIECWRGSFVILQGIRTSIAKKPFTLFYFSGGPLPPPPPPPPLWIHTLLHCILPCCCNATPSYVIVIPWVVRLYVEIIHEL